LERDDYLGRFPMFIKGNVLSVIYSPTFDFVYHTGILSKEQQITYGLFLFDYKERTGAELFLNKDKDKGKAEFEILNELKKRYSWQLREN
jgi:hypothetical protein